MTVAPARHDPGTWPSVPDPGDLSRRLASRRAELRLSLAQVARRAGVSPRYLEYLENFPGQPGAVVLRRLAAALTTTPARLLGAGANVPPGRQGEYPPSPPAPGSLEWLCRAECKRLLAPGGIGRVAFTTAAGPLILPVNYVMAEGTVVLRTSPGSVVAGHGDGLVSFEVDCLDDALHQGWSVLVCGPAHRVLQPGELRHLQRSCDLRPWPAGEYGLYVRIVPAQISGRRIRAMLSRPR